MKKSVLLTILAMVLVLSIAAFAPAPQDGATEFTYLNFKPEIAEVYDAISADYEAETGVKMNVITAASGTYEDVQTVEFAKSDPPALFQINGPIGYANWKDYTKDLKDTELYAHLSDKSLAVVDGDGVYGIPYAVEGYGIIYNQAIMDAYFATDGALAASMDEINTFDTLKAVVEDMTAKKDALGIEGVFASTSLQAGEDWRWQTHLFDVPLYYEFFDKGLGVADDGVEVFDFSYADNFKAIFDLYLNNSTTDPKQLGSKQVNDSMAEFAMGKAAMVQNGNWGWGQISGVEGNITTEENVKFLPIYIGAAGEETQGLCVGTENFYAVNAKADPAKQKAAEDFIFWLFSSDKGKTYVKEQLGFIAPFDTFADDEKPTDPLAKEVLRWMESGTKSVPWFFAIIPSQTWKDDFGANLLMYAQGTMEWQPIVDQCISEWADEYAALQ